MNIQSYIPTMIKELFTYSRNCTTEDSYSVWTQRLQEALTSGQVTQNGKFGKHMEGNHVNTAQIIQGVLILKTSGVCTLKT